MISIALAIWCGDFAFFASFCLNYYSGVLGTPGIHRTVVKLLSVVNLHLSICAPHMMFLTYASWLTAVSRGYMAQFFKLSLQIVNLVPLVDGQKHCFGFLLDYYLLTPPSPSDYSVNWNYWIILLDRY